MRISFFNFDKTRNEIFYEIFEYFDIYDDYELFYYRNSRFNIFFFIYHCHSKLISNKHRIISLRLLNLYYF